ncbi:hypothetical protein OAA83_02175 [Candidatus Marinimicrobia bacterium]|jgi:hypothetical protein|nr:hypothetical protein [Candidatus Neomarinimicrobiota bacterium]
MGLKKNKNITHPEWKKIGFIGLIVETLKNAGKNKNNKKSLIKKEY